MLTIDLNKWLFQNYISLCIVGIKVSLFTLKNRHSITTSTFLHHIPKIHWLECEYSNFVELIDRRYCH